MSKLFSGGLDYTPINKQLNLSTEIHESNISIHIMDDHLYEGNETFLIVIDLISAHVSGLEVVNNVTVTIIDNDGM